MRWAVAQDTKHEWKRWFAWFPVEVETTPRTNVWLEWVERRVPSHYEFIMEYRLIKDQAFKK